MADRITEERLRKILERKLYFGLDEGQAIAAELLAARAEVERLRGQLQADDQRAWEALDKPEGTHDTTNVQRLCAEVERLRAELRAVATIAHEGGLAQLGEGPPLTAIRRRTLCWWVRTGSLADAQARVRAAMKHKETP